MKLKKKLMPIIGLAATGMAAMSFTLTGCSKDSDEIDGMVNLLHKFVPSGPQHPWDDFYTPEEANAKFLNEDTKEEIFKQDMIWGKYKFIDYLMNRRAVSNPYDTSVNKAMVILVLNAIKDVQFGIKDVSIRRQTIGDNDYPLISYEINYRIQYDVYYETTYEQDVGVMTGRIKVHDLPYSFDCTLAESGDPSLWAFGPARNIIMYSETPIQWSVDYFINRNELQTVSIRGAVIQKQVDEDYELKFTFENWQSLGEVATDLIYALCFPETKMVRVRKYVSSDEASMAVARFDVFQSISNGLFTLSSFSWYMLPVPIRPTPKSSQ